MNRREGYKASEVAKIIGTSKRTIQLYGNARTGAVQPDIDPGNGKGTTRWFSRRNLYEFILCKELANEGIGINRMRYIISKLREILPTGDLRSNVSMRFIMSWSLNLTRDGSPDVSIGGDICDKMLSLNKK